MTESSILDEGQVAELAAAAAAFDWSWTVDDVARWCALVGWDIVETSSSGTVLARTGFRIGRPEAEIATADGVVKEVSAFVTDVVAKASKHLVVDAFAQLAQRLTTTLGAPATRQPGDNPHVRWLLPNVVIEVSASGGRTVYLDFRNPALQRHYDEMDAAPDA